MAVSVRPTLTHRPRGPGAGGTDDPVCYLLGSVIPFSAFWSTFFGGDQRSTPFLASYPQVSALHAFMHGCGSNKLYGTDEGTAFRVVLRATPGLLACTHDQAHRVPLDAQHNFSTSRQAPRAWRTIWPLIALDIVGLAPLHPQQGAWLALITLEAVGSHRPPAWTVVLGLRVAEALIPEHAPDLLRNRIQRAGDARSGARGRAPTSPWPNRTLRPGTNWGTPWGLVPPNPPPPGMCNAGRVEVRPQLMPSGSRVGADDCHPRGGHVTRAGTSMRSAFAACARHSSVRIGKGPTNHKPQTTNHKPHPPPPPTPPLICMLSRRLS